MGTGGGSPKNLHLSVVENLLIDFLTPDAIGLSNVPEGGFENIISSNSPRQDLYHSQSNLSSVQKEKRLKTDRYIFTSSSSVGDESSTNKIYLSDSSDEKERDLYDISQTCERMQSPVMHNKEITTKCEKLVSLRNNDKQNLFEKENIQVCINHL